MKIVIIGAGAVGFELARTISMREHDVILVEKDGELLNKVSEHLDVHFVEGNGAGPSILREVGMDDCDLFTAVTASQLRHSAIHFNGLCRIAGW